MVSNRIKELNILRQKVVKDIDKKIINETEGLKQLDIINEELRQINSGQIKKFQQTFDKPKDGPTRQKTLGEL